MNDDKPTATLPAHARLPVNRCNLPAAILGGLHFQKSPTALAIDGVAELHADLFRRLDRLDTHAARAQQFMDYMDVRFCLHAPEEAGWQADRHRHRRKADYLRTVRGWSFDPDAREGAVLKGWVESRFGLLPRHHGEPIASPDSDTYRRFREMHSAGIYNTNALDAQLDLLHTYCQYETGKLFPASRHLRLYRGVNRLDQHEILERSGKREAVVLLNSMSSFTDRRSRAEEFGDFILEAHVPLSKIFFFNRLLPGMLKGEDEFVVIGGVYRVNLNYF